LIAFWKYFTTPVGFLVTIYGLNIVAWGGMLFLLLCNACRYPQSLLLRNLPSDALQHRQCATRPATTLTRHGGSG
jgi:hypothetical protein